MRFWRREQCVSPAVHYTWPFNKAGEGVSYGSLNKLVAEKTIEKYVIGGSVAALFYLEPFNTDDCDVFVFLPEQGSLVTLSPLYKRLAELGYFPSGMYIVIEGIKVQFLPISTPLVQSAFDNSITVDVEGVPTQIFDINYLIAICVETGRPKDRARVAAFVEQDSLAYNDEKIIDLLEPLGLLDRWFLWTKD